MKLLKCITIIVFIDLSLQTSVSLDESLLNDESAAQKVPRRFQRQTRKAISLEKCQEYKDLVAQEYTLPGICLGRVCRVRKRKEYICNGFIGLIAGGTKAKLKEFPHMAAIGWKTSYGLTAFKCGGSLISERFVLTVAHCAEDDKGVEPSVVRLGDQNLAQSNEGAEPAEYKVKRVIKHEHYNYRSKENDIALIELEKNVTFTGFIRPACLNHNENFGANVTATGWGKTGFMKQSSDDLLKVSLEVISNQKCSEQLKDEPYDPINPSQICAGGERNKDTCEGDSGAPIQVSKPDATCVFDIVGMTSFGSFRCGSVLPSVYTRVSSFIDWIEEHAWS